MRIETILEKNNFVRVYENTYARDNGEKSFSVIEIIDLYDVSNTPGALVTAYETAYSYVSDWKSIIECMDLHSYLPEVAKVDKAHARLALAVELVRYGVCDAAGLCASQFEAAAERGEHVSFGAQVKGYGHTALVRAIENAIAACNSCMLLPHPTEVNNE